ncbi:MAG: hypothetical protein HN521_13200 [Candidatus Latescibacteria bacterium]|nr:hypothetical protein [Candidatus Latescibacterota bacterium]
MSWDSTAFLGVVALLFLTVLLVAKILTVLELKSKEQTYRRNLYKITAIESNLESSRRKYLIGLKAEGVAKNRVSQLKTRLATLKQHMEQLTLSAAQDAARKHREKEQVLEMAVLQAMGGTEHRDSHFLRVMKVIRQLIDLEDQGSNDAVVKAVQVALAEMDKNGELDATPVKEPQQQPKKSAQSSTSGVKSVASQMAERAGLKAEA